MVDRGHVHQEAARQRDVAGNARALLANGLFGDLHQDLLAFLEQVGDERNVLWLVAPEAAATSATPSAVAIECWTQRALCIGRSCGGSTHLGADIHRATYRFGLDDSFSLGLGLIELRFY